MNNKRKGIILAASLGGAVLVFILVFGTIWLGRSARNDTESAVRSVSLFYLDELAGRREQVVSANMQEKIGVIGTALDMITEEDLSDNEHLQAYQVRIKRLFNLERFAFVGADGLIYTAAGPRAEIDLYHFDPDSLDGPEIMVENLDREDKKVIIAVPTRLRFSDTELLACFMQIDMEEMLAGVSMDAQEGGSTFCNIYTRDGIALSNTVLGGLAVEGNLLEAMRKAQFEPGCSYDAFIGDFSEGKRGVTSFTYDGIRETLSYVPVEGTDWLLTYLIRESVISDSISSISEGIIRRSTVQSLLTVGALLVLFAFIIRQTRKNAKLALEKETADAENRVKQEEMEQRLRLQEELLEQKHHQEEQTRLITALASDYWSVYYVDLDHDAGVCYQAHSDVDGGLRVGDHFPYLESVTAYANAYVKDEFREEFLDFVRIESVKARLLEQRVIAYRYMVHRHGADTWEEIHFAGVRHPEDREDHLVHLVGACFVNVDSETRKTMEQKQALQDALTAAEAANKAKTAFLSNMSHEIRTPMNAILGLNKLALQDETLTAQTRDYLEKTGDSARHLLALINDILDMSRIESGRIVLRREEFSFSGMLEQINTMVISQCEDKGLHYECSLLSPVNDYYIGDDMKLKEVLINILSNAIKFTDPGGSVRLTVERTAEYENQSTLCFRIRDTGIGMDKSYIPKIFDAFSQEDSTRKNKYGSTGLGMAITKSIVEMMNGTISVESEKGAGTEFTVVIPLRNSLRTGSAEENAIDSGSLRILIVDDEEIVAEHGRLVLDEAGIRADVCHSGAEALNMLELQSLKQEPYNLVLMDWRMPEMDGVETTRQIRQKYGSEDLAIIMTAYTWDTISEAALAAGVDGFLVQPLFASSVVEEFEHIVRRNQTDMFKEKQQVSLEGCRILLAEDMEINAEIMMDILSLQDAEADHAENGKIAVEMFEKSAPGTYAAILMDIRMPVMDGLEAAATIRALDRPDAKKIPIIALTANAFDEDVQRSLQAGMNAHLTKPVDADHLFQTLEELIYEAEH